MFMIVLFLAQLATVFAAMELRGTINRNEYSSVNALTDLKDYGSNAATRARWDSLQREFSCCGGIGYNSGYEAWRNSDIGIESNSVPDSCCHVVTEGCGRGILAQTGYTMHMEFNTHGCLTVMRHKLEDQVVPVLLGYAAVGTLLALVQLMAVVFAFSYSASIARHKKLDETRSFMGAHGAHPSVPSTPR